MKPWERIGNSEQINLAYKKTDDVFRLPANKIQRAWDLVAIFDKELFLRTGKLKEIWAVSKVEAHEQWVFHGAGHLWIYNSKWEILLQKRMDNGLWDISVSWHIETSEDMRVGTLRELHEETPIQDIHNKDALEHIFDFIEDIENIKEWKIYRNNEINSVFALRYDKKVPNIQNDEVKELKFVPLEEFKKTIDDPELSKAHLLQTSTGYYEKLFGYIEKAIHTKK